MLVLGLSLALQMILQLWECKDGWIMMAAAAAAYIARKCSGRLLRGLLGICRRCQGLGTAFETQRGLETAFEA